MRPQDIVIILDLISMELSDNEEVSSVEQPNVSIQNKNIAYSLKMSEAEVSESLRRSEYAGLITDIKTKKVNQRAFLAFLLNGLKFVFPTHPGALVRGVPTAHSAMPLSKGIISDELFVWESSEGEARGQAIIPLYHTVPDIVGQNKKLYELLSLVDAIRTGNARITNIASQELEKRILQT
ncbi:hypothetical protein [Arcicella rosea]|nr:hypothetical protein [Arcicella rosea]